MIPYDFLDVVISFIYQSYLFIMLWQSIYFKHELTVQPFVIKGYFVFREQYSIFDKLCGVKCTF